nr:PAS domain-containing protein [Oscillatoria sp. FACHB-1406]
MLQAQLPHTLGSIYIYDLIDQHVTWTSCSVATLLGYTEEDLQLMGQLALGTLIHPDDLNRVSEHYQCYSVLQWGETISIDYRMKRKDGIWYWLRSTETPLVMATATCPLQILGIIQPRNIEWFF